MHGYRAGQSAGRARVLYLFRSPPNVQIGRKSLDAEVREALEHTHPDISFDWVGLLREPMPPARPDPRERGPRVRSQNRRDRPAGRERGDAPPAAAAVIEIEDESLLGQTLGGAAAAVLRARFADLNQRIARRSRTPEERDRLLEAAQLLNPDLWTDEASIRTNAAQIDARWEAVAAELPRRRRGRRGGKPREDDATDAGAADQTSAADVIIGRRDEFNERDDPQDPPVLADAAGASGGGDPERTATSASDVVGADHDPEADVH